MARSVGGWRNSILAWGMQALLLLSLFPLSFKGHRSSEDREIVGLCDAGP